MRLTIVTILVFVFTAVQSQNTRRFRHIDVNMGLAHTDATAITEDEIGFIWIGTNAGVQRYDGRQTKLYFNSLSKLNQVFNNRITALYAQNEYLWVGSEGGLNLLNLKKEKYIPLNYDGADFNANPAVISKITGVGNKLLFISNAKLYVAGYSENDNKIKIECFADKTNSTEYFKFADIISLATNNKNMLWIGTNRGIFSYSLQNGMFEFVEHAEGKKTQLDIKHNLIHHLKLYNGQLWALMPGYLQVFSLSNDNYRLRSVLKTINLEDFLKTAEWQNNYISLNDFLVDGDNNFWCATSVGLLFINEPLSQDPQTTIFHHSQYNSFSISSNNISELLLDHSNCLWAATWAGGVSYLDLEQKQFNLLIMNPKREGYSLTDPFVRAISQDNHGRVWVASQNEGVDFYYPQTGECKPFKLGDLSNNSLSSKRIRALKFHKNKMYIGTIQGINVIDLLDNSIQKYPDMFGNGNPVYAMDFDVFGNLWVGTWGGGLYKLKPEADKLVLLNAINESTNNRQHISSNQVNFVFADNTKKEILIGTKYGLNRLLLDDYGNVNKIIYYRGNDTEHSLSSEYVWPIQKESDTVYWLGTLGGGLNRLVMLDGWDKNGNGNYRATSYSVQNGAPSNDIESVLTDNNGNLWIGAKGLSVFNTQTKEFWNFDVNDGLQSNGFKIGSAFKNNNGILFFGGIKGMNYFDPSFIKRNKIKPRIVLNSLQIRNTEILPGQEINKRVLLDSAMVYTRKIKLNYKENDFLLSFASLHYANPEKCLYKYQLEGYDNTWQYIPGIYPVASYSNLKYGDYIFRVDATNGDGLWSGNPIELQIHISPPWWFSAWAYFAYVILFLSLFYSVLYYTTRWIKLRNELKLVEAEDQKKEELHQMKLQFFMNISHEFKTPLTLILTPAEKLKKVKYAEPEHNKMVQLISENANRLLKLINELMDFRKAEVGKLCLHAGSGSLKDFSYTIYQQFIPLCQKSSIAYSFNSGLIPEIWFDPEKMSSILYNLLANAINYTEEGGWIKVNLFLSSRKKINHFYEHFIEVGESDLDTEYAYIQVIDSGVGISGKSINQIFDRFYQLESSKNKHLGSGIGLALLKNLVLLHHGHVLVSSERFKGTEFLIGLPMGDNHLRPEERNLEMIDFEQIQMGKEDFISTGKMVDLSNHDLEKFKTLPSLLLVEDNQDLRDVLHEHFSHNYKVIDAENGRDALAKIEEKNIDLVITDIMMPEMDGLELVKILREDIKTSHLPIALLTAKSSVEDQIAGTESGADLYFPKPFNVTLMDLKLKQFLDSRQKLKDKYTSNVFADTRDIVRTQKDKVFIDKFVEIVEANIDNNDFSVEQLSVELNIGRTNLYKKIKSLTGLSIGEFIRSLRLKMAAKILLSEDVTISEVIYRVGISSNSYFTKTFKIQFGMTPSEFLQQNSKKPGQN